MKAQSSIYSNPKTISPNAPSLVQQEFGNANAHQVSDDKMLSPNTSQEADGFHTPLMLQVPTFGNVQTLPTPMTYTPNSPGPLARSPGMESLNMPKKRRESPFNRNLEVATDQLQQRVVSELPPVQWTPHQRIVSLPTVSEEDTSVVTSRASSIRKTLDESVSDVLIGFPISNITKAHKWTLQHEIGSGNFSKVYLYKSIEETSPELNLVAVKKIVYPPEILNSDLSNTAQYQETLSRFESSLTRELSILNHLNHPCIIKLYGINDPVFINEKRPLHWLLNKHSKLPPCNIITSYCAGGDVLAAAIQLSGNLNHWLINRIFTELTMAVSYLHKNQVIHRDLKLENLLLKYPITTLIDRKDNFENCNIIELADFGLCKKLEPDEMCTARCGSEDYVSPEILMGVPYDGHLSDTWAMGVILYALLEDRLPFDLPPNASSRQRNRSTSHRIARFEWKWYKLQATELNAKEIVSNTLTRKSNRWDIEHIMNSDYVQKTLQTLHF